MINHVYKSLKSLYFIVFTMFILTFTTQASAFELKQNSKLKIDSYSSTYDVNLSNNIFYWNTDLKNKLRGHAATATTETQEKKSNFGERMIAVGMSILVEFATNESFNNPAVR